MIRLGCIAFALLVAGCTRHSSRSQTAPFLTGPCPSGATGADTSGVVTVQKVRFAPPYFHPRHQPVTGDVLARLTVDTLGQAEPGSIYILSSTSAALSESFCLDLVDQRYAPAERERARAANARECGDAS
jgi:hypothetical protein